MASATILTLLAFVPLKQVMCDVSEVLGYNYLPPKPQPPPLQFDEPSTPSNLYLPPIFQDEIIPIAPIAPAYLPPAIYPPLGAPPIDDDTVVVPSPTPVSLYQSPVPQVKILNMSCVLDTSFRARFRLDRRGLGFPTPVVDNGVDGCVRADSSSTFFIDMEGRQKLSECGVRRCTSGASSRTNMCLVVRMPTVRGIRLPEDGLVTMQCSPQDAVVAHTKHLSLSPTTSNKGRSTNSGVVASGGGQRHFDSRIILLRKSGKSGSFDQPLQPGSVVVLGEELALRAVVQEGDGWKFSRMGPVMVRSPSSQKSVTLVEENGCRSAGMRSICPHQPRQFSPLDTLLHFRAFLFQDSSRGEDMLLSVKMLGCIHAQDCYQNGPCNDDGLTPPLRFKRDATGHPPEKNGTSDRESQFKFRVQMTEYPKQALKTVSISGEFFIILVAMFGLCLLVAIILITIRLRRKEWRR